MFRGLFTFACLVLATVAGTTRAGEVSAARPAEYMIYQYPDISLVVKIEAPGVAFEARILGPENALLKSSGIPAARIGPLYQFVGSVDIPRQLMIKVSPERAVDRSSISLELIQIPDRDPNSGLLTQAYGLLSNGTELVHSSDTTTWAMKIYTLRNAARAFAGLGWEEMRLWSEFDAAHLVLHKLGDELMALEMARGIQQSARRAGIELIELAALVLEGDALMAGGLSSGAAVASARFEQIHGVLDRVVMLAGRLGLTSEQARALYNDGLAYQLQDQQDAAIRKFQRALDTALSASNPELVNEIRSTAAAAYKSQGSTSDAIGMLEEISNDPASDSAEEVTDSLFEKGRILNDNYRYAEAAINLAEALELRKSNPAGGEPWGPVGLALAWSYYSMGDEERAVALILDSIPRTPQAQNNDIVYQAFNSLANIYRNRGDHGQMNVYRGKQRALAQSARQRATVEFESAMDAWSQQGPRSGRIRESLAQARKEATSAGDQLQARRAELYSCLLDLEQDRDGNCSAAQAGSIHESLRNSGLPGVALDADFTLVRILRREGRTREALTVMARLMEEMFLLRRELPGVLGDWYWLNREAVFETYMSMILAQSGTAGDGPANGKSALLALSLIRSMAPVDQAATAEAPESSRHDALRSLLARREASQVSESDPLVEQVNRELRVLLEAAASAGAQLTPGSLDTILARLSPEDTLLTYYFSEFGDYALLGTRAGVSLLKLTGSSGISNRLLALRERIQAGPGVAKEDLDAVGRVLLGPLSGRLEKNIYLLPAGALKGFPFNALRLKRKFLAEHHEVINLVGLSPDTQFRPGLPPEFSENVFLAGNPQTSQELFSYEVRVSPEISALTERFVGPGLQIVQGVALRADEFRDSRFTGAGLIHLATPGSTDLGNPEHSRLLMSGLGEGSTELYLSPADIRGLSLEAGLVVLSQFRVSGVSLSNFDNRLGFVSDFLEAGAGNVVASLWADENGGAMRFIDDFYDQLEAGHDVPEALSRARKTIIQHADEMNLRSWAGFQLFIR